MYQLKKNLSARRVVISTTGTELLNTILYRHNLSTRKLIVSHKCKMSGVYERICILNLFTF